MGTRHITDTYNHENTLTLEELNTRVKDFYSLHKGNQPSIPSIQLEFLGDKNGRLWVKYGSRWIDLNYTRKKKSCLPRF